MEINNRRYKRFNNFLKKNKVWLLIAGLLVISSLRIYFNCVSDVTSKCIEKTTVIQEEGRMGKFISKFKNASSIVIRKYFPSPHSELLMGTIMGADELSKVPKFKEALKSSGTIHVVVVSGFNISLVFGFVLSILGSKTTIKNLLISQLFTLIYAVMTGFQPPVIRAVIMGSVVAWTKYYQGSLGAFKVLLITALLMIIIWPSFLFNPSFQLSFLATLGLVVFGNSVSNFMKKIFKSESFFVEDLSTTVSAQIFVLPFVSYYFGRISIVSFLVNPLILWTIPIITVLGMIFILFAVVWDVLGYVSSFFVYPFLDIFVRVVSFFSRFDFSSVSFSANIKILLIYYLFTILAVYFIYRRRRKIYEIK